MATLRKTATIEPFGPAGAIILSDDEVALITPGPKVFPVTVTMNGSTFPLRLARMGGQNCIGLRKEIRAAAGITLGDAIEVEIVADVGERVVDVPPELATVLEGDDDAKQRFDALAYTHRKEFAQWVAEAKRESTKADRVEKTLQMLREGRRRS